MVLRHVIFMVLRSANFRKLPLQSDTVRYYCYSLYNTVYTYPLLRNQLRNKLMFYIQSST